MHSSVALLCLLPLVSCAALPRRAPTGSWQVSDIATHYMGDNSGIANGAWPPGSGFNSTISFTLSQNFANTTHETAPTAFGCSAQWVPKGSGAQAYPTDWVQCGGAGSGTSWKFLNTTTMNEGYAGAFILDIKQEGTVHGVSHEFAGKINITANDYTAGDNSITCLGGAPLTGIHCTGGPFTAQVTNDKVIS
ncbi:hypothetical protein EV356DRAFT_564486 [Viridothelium virens]|uniref:Uncharacterized protein n=1 Tax=Viridothelium virens TaxID=1048519 RepID=A0A6A6HIU9_VIRVR|nr:hypothetical protein EV356DRAFT_564486 [Viridothelium virens]